MSRYTLTAYTAVPRVGGIYIVDELKPFVQAEGRVVLDFALMPPAKFNGLVNVVRHGFSISKGTGTSAILRMLTEEPSAPKIPDIGYLGKREMRVLVARQNAQQYRTDLIAAGHMMDVDLSEAVGVQVTTDWSDLAWLSVDSYHVAISGQKSGSYHTRRAAGIQLRPATSKLGHLIKQWTLETYHTRAPLVDWLNTKPRLEWSLSRNLA